MASTDKNEFLEMLTRYQGILHKVNLVYFHNPTDREDNFQEMIYQLWKSFPSLQQKEKPASWIYAVSINTSISRLRKNPSLEYPGELPDASDGTDLSRDLSERDMFARLIDAIHKLDEIDRSLMFLYLEERSYDDIAGILGISKTNVGVRINRAKIKLGQYLKMFENER
jgi:RNA polymerase sigma-70 factor (ECF subfamily)